MNPVSAATIAVTTTDDELNASYATDCDPGNESDCSLREAIELSNENEENDTINIPAGTFTLSLENSGSEEDNNQTGDLDIFDDNGSGHGYALTISGATQDSTIIDGAEIDRVFDVPYGKTTFILEDLTVQNGAIGGTDSGGALHYDTGGNTSITLVVQNVTVIENTAFSGGGVYIENGEASVIIDNVLFGLNSANGGNDNSRGGGLYITEAGSVSMNDTSFIYNYSSGLGAAAALNNTTQTTITNGLFQGSSNAAALGILCSSAGDQIVRVTNAIFDANEEEHIFAHCGFSSNQTNEVVVAHSTFQNAGAAALRALGSTNGNSSIEVIGSIFSDNDTGCQTSTDSSIFTAGYNIIDSSDCGFDDSTDMENTDPLLDGSGLEDNGGQILTIGLQPESPAIDSVPSGSCIDARGDGLDADARGYGRPEEENCDAGAYERDQTDPTISLNPSNVTLECAVDSYTAPVATVSDSFDPTVSEASQESSTVDEDTVGSYNAVYATDADYDGNISRAIHLVTVEDTLAPLIVVDESEVSAEAGEAYTDSGVSITEACDTDIELSTSGSVDTDTLGEYTLIYNTTDASDNAATQKTRTVTVEDTTAPVITLVGESSVTLTVGESYTDAGATALDSFEGTLTDSIVVTGGIDTQTVGEYTLTYNVSDSSGNAATVVTRTVTVERDSDEPVNDPATGEGDGSGDTEETLGVVTGRVRLTGGQVQVSYADGSSKIFQIFNINAKPKVQLHTNGEILIAINKRYMRTFDAFTGEQIDQVKLFKAKQYKTKFNRFNIYKKVPGKNNVMVLAQTKKKHKKKFKLRSFVVKNNGNITRRAVRNITLNKKATFAKLSISKNKKSGKKARILVKKNGKTLKNWKYRVTKKKGILKKVD